MKIIGGIYKNRELVSPKGETTRPTSSKARETLFNICQNEINEAYFLDLFAGSGAMGFEALSRGAAKVTFVEKNSFALEALRKNIATFHEEVRCTIMKMDVFRALAQFAGKKESFDIIYADPPYGLSLSDQVLRFVEEHPFLLSQDGQLFLEDEWKGQKKPFLLMALKLKSRRRIGKAELCHYVKDV